MKYVILIPALFLAIVAGYCLRSSLPSRVPYPATSTINPIEDNLVNGDLGEEVRASGVPFASYEVLGETNGGETKYIWALVESYHREGGVLKPGSGTALPLAVHLTKEGDGYIVKSVERPGEANYLEDIKKLFPFFVRIKISLRSFNVEDLAASNLKKAEAYFLLQDQSPPPYRSLFSRDATPEWKLISVDGFHVSVPYSPDWKVSLTGISVFDGKSDESGTRIIFGRPQDDGTFIFRQYALSRTTKVKDIFPPDMTFALMSNMCGEPERISVGKIQGIKLFNGGAKGCYIGFTFNIGTHTYELSKIPDIGDNPSRVVDEEMAKIIQSIYE